MGTANVGGRNKVGELEESVGGGSRGGGSSSKLVQRKNWFIGNQQNFVWSLPVNFAESRWLNLNHLEKCNRPGAHTFSVKPVSSPHEDGDLTDREMGG